MPEVLIDPLLVPLIPLFPPMYKVAVEPKVKVPVPVKYVVYPVGNITVPFTLDAPAFTFVVVPPAKKK